MRTWPGADGVVLHRAPALQRLRMVKDTARWPPAGRVRPPPMPRWSDLVADGGLRPGRTERDVALDLEHRMRGHGASGPAFETIVAAGPNSAIPHHRPTPRAAPRDLVTMDFGALVDVPLRHDRTVVLGPAADWQRELYALVGTPSEAGRAALAPYEGLRRGCRRPCGGGPGRSWAAVRAPAGHGVGLQIHEARCAATRRASGRRHGGGPRAGVYLEGRGGVRTEDILLVCAGPAQLLTTSPRELLEVG